MRSFIILSDVSNLTCKYGWNCATTPCSIAGGLPFKSLVSVEERVSVEEAPLRSASLRSGKEGKHPQMLLVLGWRSLILLELRIYKPRFRRHHVSFWVAISHSGVLFMGNKNIIEFPHILNTCVWNKILKAQWGVL